jgi:hypothetical protein
VSRARHHFHFNAPRFTVLIHRLLVALGAAA